MERINENVIRVMLSIDDLRARGIDFTDMIGNQESIEEFFYLLLEEIDVDNHFRDSEALTFQIMPAPNGKLEIYITRADGDDYENMLENYIRNKLLDMRRGNQSMLDFNPDRDNNDNWLNRQDSEERALSRLMNLLDGLSDDFDDDDYDFDEAINKDIVIRFNGLEDFIHYSRSIKNMNIESSLYLLDNIYYLVVEDFLNNISDDDLEIFSYKAFEFGIASDNMPTKAVLDEHGELIYEGDTISYFGNNL